ncbi:hypothetical protein [Psychrobacter lutiphocae]|uniref:hypothetical protein n=1 Tax=Psychrobacter lutiphocae TaxID=540500 RepID=UPI00037B98E7|nr:hypothetical protein [Psychrobacter lutiphocae]
MHQTPHVGLTYHLISAFFAFVLWGGWAYYVNAGSENQLTSALTQGLASCCITLVLVRLVSFIFQRLPEGKLRLILPGLLAVSLTGSCLILTHRLVGTAHIFFTIAPALTVAFIFCVITAVKLQKSVYNSRHLPF